MGEELVPFPLLRFPCLYDEDAEHVPTWCEAFFKYNEFETTRKYRVKSYTFGTCRIVFSIFILLYYTYYAVVLEKSYLDKAVTNGFSRLGIQHPVQNGCNPLDVGCQANFQALENLSYCHPAAAGTVGEHSIDCAYLDQYDIYRFDTGADSSNYLIPTRISVFEQTLNPGCESMPCTEPYSILSATHKFVADIENYTILIDHSFICEDNAMTGDSYALVGFLRECPHEGGEDEESFDMEECPTWMVGHPPDLPNIPAIADEYDSLGEATGVNSYSVGDILKVSELLRIAGVDLDAVQGDDDQHGTVRYEGEVIIIEIHYRNYKEGHWPNSLPPVYEYRVYRLPTQTYKMTDVELTSPTTRTVRDIHGIHVQVRVMGMVGKMSLTKTVMVCIEIVAFLSILNWILTCCAFNSSWGKNGDEFYNKVHEEYNIEHLHKDNVLKIGLTESEESEEYSAEA